jgi:hypothetical protein
VVIDDRIYELARQADLIEFEPIGDSNEYTPNHTSVVKARKFARLIVRECAAQLIKWKDEPFPYDPEFGASLIKEHFGVEE